MSERDPSLLEQLARLTGQVAGQTLDVAKNTATMTAMFGRNLAPLRPAQVLRA